MEVQTNASVRACGGGRARAVALLAAILVTGSAAAASAQVDPYATVEEHATQNDLDTDLTPVAKQTDLWTLVHGAKFGDTDVVKESVTSFDVDLFDVSFRNTTIGLAGGSACPTTPQRQIGESASSYGSRVAACKAPDGSPAPRVPSAYLYTAPFDGDPTWKRLELPGGDRPGYIGAIAWIDASRALLVGGTGSYPRREAADDGKAPTDPAKTDGAGKARAWVYHRDSGSLEELDLSKFTPNDSGPPVRAGMRGFTAVGCYTDPKPEIGEVKLELCFAGGLGQIWEWRDGTFNGKRVDALSPDNELDDASLFRYRVRDLKFSPVEPPAAAAVTAGCCAQSELENTPRVIAYREQSSTGSPRWYARTFSAREVNTLGVVPESASTRVKELNDRPVLPDSYYSLTMAASGGFSVIATPGGPERSDERPSVISMSGGVSLTGPPNPPGSFGFYSGDTPEFSSYVLRTPLSTARLLSGSGDVAKADPNRPSGSGTSVAANQKSDSQPDWAVGELRSTRVDGLGARGLIVATALPPTASESINEGRGTAAPTPEEVASGNYEPLDRKKFDAHVRSRHYLLPSYTANSIEIVGAEEDGWAVGDHGAILRLSVSQAQATAGAAEPAPPQLGNARAEPLSERRAYFAEEPQLPSGAGVVPAIGDEVVQLPEPSMVPSGLTGSLNRPNGVKEIIMSRDGSEGWAIGEDGAGATFFYYDGSSWSRCDPAGIVGIVQPDPTCAEMASTRGYRTASGQLTRTVLVDVARVPLENDTNPSNDDELEIVGVVNNHPGSKTGEVGLIRYREGKWRFERSYTDQEKVRAPREVAFTAPDDGWVRSDSGSGFPARLFHFDGERWFDCRETPQKCDDPDRQMPAPATIDNDFSGLATAGDRVYLYGSRRVGETLGGGASTGRHVPLIIYRERGGKWTDGSGPGEDNAGFDPAFANPATEEAGRVEALSVAFSPDGQYEGWAVGAFGSGLSKDAALARIPLESALMRLDPLVGEGWRRFRSPGAFEDQMLSPPLGSRAAPSQGNLQVTYPSALDPDDVFIGQRCVDICGRGGHIFGFDAARQRFEMLDSGRPQGSNNLVLLGEAHPDGDPTAMAPDGRGGFWAAVSGYMFHYTDRAPRPVFEEVASPLGSRGVELVAIDGGFDGSVWAASASDSLYRYQRGLGWEEVRIPGWEPGRVVTNPARASAIAAGPGGEGIAVGEGGRIVELSPDGVALDPAAGRSCALGDAAPCGSSRDLNAVDIAPDGSVIVGGDRLSLLWRPPGGEFRAIAKPKIASSMNIEAISYAAPDRAYLVSGEDTGQGAIFRGDMAAPGEWRWRIENLIDAGERFNSLDSNGRALVIRDVAVDASGHGYAVGDGGLVMERTEQDGWRRLASRYPRNLSAVELPETGGDGVLIGGADGLVLTGAGSELHLARPGDFHGTGDIVGFAYLPGAREGSVDAWAGTGATSGSQADSRLFRYRSEPENALLDPAAASTALPDSPPHAGGELSIAAFGKSDCDQPEANLCPPFSGTTVTNEIVNQRIVEELAERHERGELDLAVLSGDAVDSAGLPASSVANYDRLGRLGTVGEMSATQMAGQLKHRRYAELIADQFTDRGVPLFGAIGSQDLSETYACASEGCQTTKRLANAGENLAWREAFGGAAEPWGNGEHALGIEAGLEIVPAPGGQDQAVRVEDRALDADGAGTAPETRTEIGGASTHYAIDVEREGQPLARIVFVDSSLRSLVASDPLQQPHDVGGQTRFLERMICKRGQTTSTGDPCTREPDQAAIVVSNTPTYSYGPGALTHTATDATTFEALMLRYDVDLVISGALGYNGLYYTLAPGIHEPCPGGDYPKAPPRGDLPDCIGGAELPHASELLAEQGLTGEVPTLIASGAGGKFGPDGQQQADGAAGLWHGYSVARLMPDGEVAIEQRPIFDWIGMGAADHTLGARSKLQLHGYGRSPLSTITQGQNVRAFHYGIETAAITHRYDLLLADQSEPWVPCKAADPACGALYDKLAGGTKTFDGAGGGPASSARMSTYAATAEDKNRCEPYLCLPERIATVDRWSGEVQAGNGKYPDTFAVAMLSVGEKVATWPLYFKRSPSFVVEPVGLSAPIPAAPSAAPSQPAPPSPPIPPQPSVPQPTVPNVPLPPPVAPIAASEPPEPQPPAPPAPPPPTEQRSPFGLALAPPGIAIATPTAVIQPPTPPVNPAPPGGARREARQRQAATQKSGADSTEGSEAQHLGGDSVGSPDAPHGAAFARRDRTRVEGSFAALARAEQPSAWAQGALYTGGISLVVFAMAAGWSRGRPTSRRRSLDTPAPAQAWMQRR